MNKTVIRSLLLAATIGATPVRAEPPILVEALPTVSVPYGDLDLSRPAGQAALYGRVRRAANLLCASDERGIGPVTQQRVCRGVAMASAASQIDRAIAMAGTPQFAQRGSITLSGR